MAHSIYLSFAPEDSPVAKELASYIQSRDLVPVLSNQVGPASEPVMIVLFTDYTNTCDTVLNDFKIATTRRIPIVGLRIAASFLNNEIESLNPHVEWITSIIGNPNNHFPKLIDQVAIHLQGVHIAAHLETSSTYQHQPHVHQEPKAEIRPVRSDDAPPVVTAPKPAREPEHETYTVVLLDRGNAIETIALVRELTGLGLKESKDLVDSVPVNIAVAKSLQEAEGYATYLASSGARTRVQPRNAPDEIAPQSALNAPPMIVDAGPMFDVILRSPGTNKLILIKIIRQMTGLGLSECKELVEGPMPQTLARVGTIEEANKLRDLLYASGAMADAVEATPATAPHFVRRPLPPQGCSTTVLTLIAALLVLGAMLFR